MSLFKVENLCIAVRKASGEIPVVRDLCFSLDKGTIHGLVGQSGAGKTITANALNGLLPEPFEITGGSIWFKGKHFKISDKKVWKKLRGQMIFMIFQSAAQALNPALKTGIQLTEALRQKEGLSHKKALTIIGTLLDKVGLDSGVIDQYPFELSGGMRQRVQIATALALQPDILIADEPTTGLDSITQSGILDLLTKLKEETGTALLFISHDLRAVASVAKTVSVMKEGRIVETGDVNEIFRAPRHSYTKEMIKRLCEMEKMRCPTPF